MGDDMFKRYRAFLTMYQKCEKTWYSQCRALRKIWNEAINQLYDNDFEEVHFNDSSLPSKDQLGYFFFDSMSYPIVSKRLLERAFWLKRCRKDSSDFIVPDDDIHPGQKRKRKGAKNLQSFTPYVAKHYEFTLRFKTFGTLRCVQKFIQPAVNLWFFRVVKLEFGQCLSTSGLSPLYKRVSEV